MLRGQVTATSSWAIAMLLTACGPATARRPQTCDERFVQAAAPASFGDLAALVELVRLAHYPELLGVRLDVVDLQSETDFFNAFVNLSTIESPPLKRRYVIKANGTKLFSDGPGGHATAAILAHELKHIVDYTQKSSDDLVGFGLWYATADTRDYERKTDERALELGCSEGLKAFRTWMYPRLSAEAAELKRRNYFTPEEIDAWVAAHATP